jgi:hypothetical protein
LAPPGFFDFFGPSHRPIFPDKVGCKNRFRLWLEIDFIRFYLPLSAFICLYLPLSAFICLYLPLSAAKLHLGLCP